MYSCLTVKYAKNLAWEGSENVTDVEKRDIGLKIVPRDQVDPVGTGSEDQVVVRGIPTPEIHMLTTIGTDTLPHLWTDSGHIQTPMTDDPHPPGTPTTGTETPMQDHHQSITEEGKLQSE